MTKGTYRGPKAIVPVGIGVRIDDLCYKRNISWSILAELIGINRKTMYSYLEGTTEIKLWQAAVIADYFGVTLDWLYWGDKKRWEKDIYRLTKSRHK